MGPRSEDRGNVEDQRAADERIPASMGPRSEDRGNDISGPKAKAKREASMGPRSEDRGNKDFRTDLSPASTLQWGRDLKIAEIQAEVPGAAGPHHASMGPRSEDRGNPDRPLPPDQR